MQLYSPLSTTPRRKASRAPALGSIDGLRIGILENGKLNAEEMLNEVAALFVQHFRGIQLAVFQDADAAALQGRDRRRARQGPLRTG